jgi:serine protease Do
VADDRALPRIVADTAPGTQASVEVFRRGAPVTLTVTVERLDEGDAARAPSSAGDADPAAPELLAASDTLFGMTLEPLTETLRRRFRIHPDAEGLVVVEIDPASDAAGKVRPGDVVEEIAWTRVETLQAARDLVEQAGGSPILFSLNRQGQYVLETLRG